MQLVLLNNRISIQQQGMKSIPYKNLQTHTKTTKNDNNLTENNQEKLLLKFKNFSEWG